jgi:hypothetical protein
MVTYAADSHTRYGCLAFYPASVHPAGSLLTVREWGTNKYLGEIAQVPYTYSVVGNMNERQVVIGESTWGGLASQRDPDGMVDYGSLMYICLKGTHGKRGHRSIHLAGKHIRLCFEW